MKLSIYHSILLIFTVSLFSCQKDDSIESGKLPAYASLKKGNYWIYQQFSIDESGNEFATSSFDSCYVEKDTMINKKHYFKVYRPYPLCESYQYLRDSLQYIVNSHGEVIFSSKPNSNALSTAFVISSQGDTICQVVRKMSEINDLTVTPAGVFNTINSKQTFEMFPRWRMNGNQRFRSTRYAVNIGIVTETFPFFYVFPGHMERRLVRYHVN